MKFKDILEQAVLGDLIRFMGEKGVQVGRLVKRQKGEGLRLPSILLMTHQTIYADGRIDMHLVPLHCLTKQEFEIVERLPPGTWRVIDAHDTLKFWSKSRRLAEDWILDHAGKHHALDIDQIPQAVLALAA